MLIKLCPNSVWLLIKFRYIVLSLFKWTNSTSLLFSAITTTFKRKRFLFLRSWWTLSIVWQTNKQLDILFLHLRAILKFKPINSFMIANQFFPISIILVNKNGLTQITYTRYCDKEKEVVAGVLFSALKRVRWVVFIEPARLAGSNYWSARWLFY